MRNSNIELLRIIGLLMVISIHVVGVGLSANSISFQTFNWLFANITNSFSRVAVPCFVLISGYFMYSKQVKVLQVVKKVLFPLIFYSVGMYIVFLYKIPQVVIPLLGSIKALINSNSIYYHYWYVYVYLGLVLICPYLNAMLVNLTRNMFIRLLCTLYIICSLFPTINQIAQTSLVPEGLFNSRLLLFITLYIHGVFIKVHGIKISKKLSIILYFISCMAVAILTSLYSVVQNTFISSFYDYSNLFVIFGSVSLFCFFKDLKPYFNTLINNIGSCTYGGYLIHVMFISMLQFILPSKFIPFLSYDSTFFAYKNIIFIGTVLICSIGIEFIRLSILNYISSKFSR